MLNSKIQSATDTELVEEEAVVERQTIVLNGIYIFNKQQ